MLRTICLLALLALTAGCVTPPPMQAPLPVAKPGASFALGRVKELDTTGHVQQHLDAKKNIVYFQNFGGGGAGLGIALGPLGVAANISMIEANTKEDVEKLRDRIAIDPPAVFAAASTRAGTAVQLAASAEAPRASPYLYVVKTTPETLALAAALMVESGDGAQWPRKYMAQLPGTFTLASLAALDQPASAQLSRDLEEGFVAVLRALPRETKESIAKESQIKFKSQFLNPRFDFEMLGNPAGEEPDLVWVRSPLGLFGVRRSHITYTVQPRQ